MFYQLIADVNNHFKSKNKKYKELKADHDFNPYDHNASQFREEPPKRKKIK